MLRTSPGCPPAAPRAGTTNPWVGAYSTRGTGKGGLLAESAAITRALQRGVAPAALRAAVLAGRILPQRARVTREGILKRLAPGGGMTI